jgi:predicted MFS family arabinose efflux permease
MLIFPTIILVLRDEFTTGLAMLGVIASISTFMYGFGALPTGYLEKKLGTSSLLKVFQIGTIFSGLIVATAQSLFILILGLILVGLFSSIYHPTGLTIISRNSSNLSKGMAIHGMGGSVGLALGPMIGAISTELGSWRYAYVSIVVINLFLFFITLIISKNWEKSRIHRKSNQNSIQKTNKSALKYYFIISILMGFSFTGFTTFMPVHFAFETRELLLGFSDTLRGGLFTTLVLLAGILGQAMGGWAGGKFSLPNYLLWIIFLNIPMFILMGLVSGYILIVAAFVLGIVHFNWQPIANSLLANLTNTSHRGLGYGINFFLNIGFGSGAAAFGGFIAEKYGVHFIFPIMGFILIPALFFNWILITKVNKV